MTNSKDPASTQQQQHGGTTKHSSSNSSFQNPSRYICRGSSRFRMNLLVTNGWNEIQHWRRKLIFVMSYWNDTGPGGCRRSAGTVRRTDCINSSYSCIGSYGTNTCGPIISKWCVEILYNYVQLHTITDTYVQVRTRMYKYVRTSTYKCVQVHTSTYNYMSELFVLTSWK